MPDQVPVETTRGVVVWTFDRPPVFNVVRRSAPTLTYPWQIASAGDWNIPTGSPLDDGDGPPLSVMPPDGTFVWLLQGDVQRENTAQPGSWPRFPPYRSMSPSDTAETAGARSDVTPLTHDDRAGSRWPRLVSWWRTVLLTEATGEVAEEPLYLTIRAFAGPQRTSISAVDSLISSLRYRYAS